MKTFVNFAAMVVSLAAALAPTAIARADGPALPDRFKGIGIDQRLNTVIPLDTVFRDETGASVPLRSYFGNRAVLLVPVYFRCPMLCSQVLSGMVAGLRPLSLKPGRDFEIVAISFDPADTPADALKERNRYSSRYSSKAGISGWHFLTGTEPSIRAIMDAVGFHYRWDPANKIFVHPSGIMILTPEGRLARYLYGVEYEPKDLKLSLIEASNNRIGSPVDQILLFCYHYDPKTGKYGAVVINTLRLAAILMLVALAFGMWIFWRRDLRQHSGDLKGLSHR
jgi:protein SCO1/2